MPPRDPARATRMAILDMAATLRQWADALAVISRAAYRAPDTYAIAVRACHRLYAGSLERKIDALQVATPATSTGEQKAK